MPLHLLTVHYSIRLGPKFAKNDRICIYADDIHEHFMPIIDKIFTGNIHSISKNLPQTNLSTILDMHKSNKYSSKNLIASKFSSVNNDFEANFKRVRIVYCYFFVKLF